MNENQVGHIDKIYKEEFESINIVVNGDQITMLGKKEYILVDIFDYIDFDLTVPKGNINITLNGLNAQYTGKFKEGDVFEVFWSEL